MKIFAIMVLLLSCFVPWGLAQQGVREAQEYVMRSEGPWELSLFGGGVFPRQDDRFDDTEFAGGRLTYDLSSHVALGIESGWLRFDDEIGGTEFGKIDGIPALGVIQLKGPIEDTGNRFVPYVIAGAGVIIWNYRENTVLKDAGAKVDTDTHFAAKGGMGFDYFINSAVAFFVEGSYLFSRFTPKVHGGGTTVTTKADTEAILAGAGLKFRF